MKPCDNHSGAISQGPRGGGLIHRLCYQGGAAELPLKICMGGVLPSFFVSPLLQSHLHNKIAMGRESSHGAGKLPAMGFISRFLNQDSGLNQPFWNLLRAVETERCLWRTPCAASVGNCLTGTLISLRWYSLSSINYVGNLIPGSDLDA